MPYGTLTHHQVIWIPGLDSGQVRWEGVRCSVEIPHSRWRPHGSVPHGPCSSFHSHGAGTASKGYTSSLSASSQPGRTTWQIIATETWAEAMYLGQGDREAEVHSLSSLSLCAGWIRRLQLSTALPDSQKEERQVTGPTYWTEILTLDWYGLLYQITKIGGLLHSHSTVLTNI